MAYVPYDPNRPKQKPKDRSEQDLQAAKERGADKSKFIKQVQGAKSDMSAFGDKPYAKSTPGSNAIVNKNMAAKAEAPKAEAPKAEAPKAEAPKAEAPKAEAPKTKPVAKAAPKAKSQFEKMQDAYEGFGKGSDSAANKAIQSRIEGKGVAKAPAMKKGGSACKGYAKGGSVRSAASRGDGCATKGHTKGAMR